MSASMPDHSTNDHMTIEHSEYFRYLRTRSVLGGLYRRHVLYPRICKRLDGRTIDVGCGIGDMLTYRNQTYGVDVNPHTVAYCRSIGLEAVHMEMDRLPHGSDSFDSALLDNVLEHLVDPQPLLLEIHRVLRFGGRLVVGVPGRKGWESDDDHKVYYDELALRETVCAAGFEAGETFYAPLWRSEVLSKSLRQYCVYQVFSKMTW